MDVAWKNGFDIPVVLDRLFSLSKEHHIHSLDADSLVIFTVLRSMLNFPQDFSSETRLELVSKGCEAAVKAKAKDPEAFIRHVRAAVKVYGKRSLVTHVMYTSITVTSDSLLTSTMVGDVSIKFLKAMPKVVKAQRQRFFDRNGHWLAVAHEPKMKAVRAEVEARSMEDAAEKCLAAVDLLRGIWNFLKTPPWRITFGGPRKPINAVFLGPIHTFHNSAGELESEQFWYEPSLQRDTPLLQLDAKAAETLKTGAKIRAMLRKHAYRDAMESAFVRYARAMDSIDLDMTIQKLWSLLEFLTDTGMASYDKTIRRVRFLSGDERFTGQVLEHLRRYRNRSVHGGHSEGDVESEVYQVKRYVDAMIRYHLVNQFKFSSMAQACEMLDLPPDETQLKSKLGVTLNAMKFRKVPR
ncbi:hypothetical protein [Roseateles violae]|uniref:Apea-like HEPN domain-containing protein n=1 Tax=Roseateles violae TaxID=3058042 RepID=A0ABT8E033_9BURK|nr:hypothetical protein [Pelomonas sp. PFR6]MDN3923226.1 hypothetical protein [Pelomonas sp. PFR6]